jgi:hypothetical protein
MKLDTGCGVIAACEKRQLCGSMAAGFVAAILAIAPAGAAPTTQNMSGGWMLDRAASKLTRPLAEAETVVIVPWGQSGWVWNQISGGPYQPEELLGGVVAPPEVDGPAADAVKPPRPSIREMYYASWDGRTYRTYGRNPGQVQLTKTGDRTFAATFSANGRTDSAALVFSADGKHLTVTVGDDMRVYDRIDPTSWPSRTIEPPEMVPAPGAGLPCAGIWTVNESLTHRTRSPLPPAVQVFGPWGRNGWVAMNMAGMDAQGVELAFNQFNRNAYQIYANDSHEQAVRQLDNHRFEVTAVRYKLSMDRSIVQFSNDCRRLTITVPEGTDRRRGVKYYNDVRVFDRIDP